MTEPGHARNGDTRIPVILLTGFLGSGKTTLLRHLLSEEVFRGTAVIVNEFGDIDFNDILFADAGGDVVPANAGCFCCTGRAQLAEAFQELEDRAAGAGGWFSRVIIESSGLADPAPVLQALINDRQLVERYRIDSVVTVVDAVTGLETLEEREDARRQVAFADLVAISKTDVCNPSAVGDLRAEIGLLNPRVAIAEIAGGRIDPKLVLGAGADRLSETATDAAGRGIDVHAHPGKGDRVETWTFRPAFSATRTGLALWMDLMASYRGNEVLRMKGVLDVEGTPVLVESIRHVFHPPVELDRWPDDQAGSRIVVIAQGLEKADVERTLNALRFAAVETPLDPAAYANFRETIGLFKRS